jgi:hypothetical protein
MIGKKILAAFLAVALVASIFVLTTNEETTVLAWPPATTPGVNDFGNATKDLVYDPDTAVTVRINSSGMTAGTYFLYKPAYNCSGTGYRYATQLEWFEQVLRTDTSTAVTLTVTTPGNIYTLSGPIILDRAGMWVFGDDPHTIDGNDSTTFQSFFWVNSSQELEIDSFSDFEFGVNSTKTITVQQAGDTPDLPVNIDLIAPDGSVVFHRLEADGIYAFGTWGNITMAGNYTIRAYSDLDEYSSEAYLYNDEGIGEGYDETYGMQFSNAKNTTLAGAGDGWAYGTCGPWDPPEINATEIMFRVRAGEPQTSIPEGNQTMYWNFSGEVNISVKDTSDDPIPATGANRYHVTIYNQNDEDVTSYFEGTGDGDDGNISMFDGYVKINSTRWGKDNFPWTSYGGNGTWYAYIYVGGSDRTEPEKEWTEEWNATVEWTVRSAPGAQFKWVDDDAGLSSNNNDGELPYIPSSATAPVTIQFQIIGDDHTYYGAGGATALAEAKENISISGNALFTGKLDKVQGVTFTGGTTWNVPIIPTMSQGGGSIDIVATWEDYGSISETLAIGGTNYRKNGTIVTVTPNEFEIDTDQTFSVDVKFADGTSTSSAACYLFYVDDGEVATAGDPLQGHTVSMDLDGFDGYSLGLNTTQQRDNQTNAGFGSIKAPRNLTVYVVAYIGPNPVYGWALIKMKPTNDLKVTFEALDSPATSTLLAGYKYSYFYINITKIDDAGNASDIPDEDDYTDLTVKIYDEDGDDVTTSIGSLSASDMSANNMGKDYIYKLKNEYITKAGMFTVYAKNHTSDSTDNNASIDVKQAQVECDKAPFIWAYDDNISATFTVTSEITGGRLNGTLRIENMTWTDGTYNRTWTNTSEASNDTVDLSDNQGFTNGQITVNDITANFLPTGEAMRNITFWFKPELSDGSDGEWAKASGKVAVSVPTVTPSPMYASIGTITTITCTVTGRGTPLEDIFVGLNGRGISVSDTNGTTGTDGTIEFSITPSSTGDIDIHVGEEGRIVKTKIIVTNWMLDVSVDSPQVNEGSDFTVTVMRKGTTTAVEDATVSISGIGSATTDATGKATFTAPSVTSDSTYTIKATKEGYREDTNIVTIKVINKPKIFMSAPTSANQGESFTIKAGADDGNNNGILVSIKKADGTLVASEPTVNGQATFKLTEKQAKAGSYTITATMTGYVDADPITIKLGQQSPGFELLTLIIALGVALILVRRRRK